MRRSVFSDSPMQNRNLSTTSASRHSASKAESNPKKYKNIWCDSHATTTATKRPTRFTKEINFNALAHTLLKSRRHAATLKCLLCITVRFNLSDALGDTPHTLKMHATSMHAKLMGRRACEYGVGNGTGNMHSDALLTNTYICVWVSVHVHVWVCANVSAT